MVSAVRADATEVPMPMTKSSSTNGLTGLPATVQGGKLHPNFENKKKISEKIFYAPLPPEKYAESIGEIRF